MRICVGVIAAFSLQEGYKALLPNVNAVRKDGWIGE
jgi:hypothetical protein